MNSPCPHCGSASYYSAKDQAWACCGGKIPDVKRIDAKPTCPDCGGSSYYSSIWSAQCCFRCGSLFERGEAEEDEDEEEVEDDVVYILD